MLKAFGFITHVEHPHKLLLNVCQVLLLDQVQEPGAPNFLQEAWNVANDRCDAWGSEDISRFFYLADAWPVHIAGADGGVRSCAPAVAAA